MRVAEVHLETHKFVQPLPLDEYRQKVGHHLDLIAAGAEMTARHVRAMDRRPGFDTSARAELELTEAILERALSKIQTAKAEYDRKPQEASHVA